jgi:hypothetical protein
MPESSGFFDAVELTDGTFDREYMAEQFANYFKLFVGNGVFANPTNQLKVVASSAMNIVMKEGWAFINGYWYHNDADKTINISSNTLAETRKDGIFIRFDLTNRNITQVYEAGRSEVNRTSPYYELKIAEVAVNSGVTEITDSVITDTRADNIVCGFVTGLFDIIGTTDLFAQYNAIFNEWILSEQSSFTTWRNSQETDFTTWKSGQQTSFNDWLTSNQNSFSDWKTSEQTDFNTWFSNMKNDLTENQAANLENRITTHVQDTSVHMSAEEKQQIATNTKNISTNTTNIQKNTDDIATLKTQFSTVLTGSF